MPQTELWTNRESAKTLNKDRDTSFGNQIFPLRKACSTGQTLDRESSSRVSHSAFLMVQHSIIIHKMYIASIQGGLSIRSLTTSYRLAQTRVPFSSYVGHDRRFAEKRSVADSTSADVPCFTNNIETDVFAELKLEYLDQGRSWSV